MTSPTPRGIPEEISPVGSIIIEPLHSFGMINDERRKIRLDSADDLLAARIHRSLIATGRRQLAELNVTVAQGCVRMSGNVPSYYAKQLAHQAVLSIDGIRRIDCEIDVE